LLDFAGDEELFELGGEVVDAVGDVEVADDEDEDHGCCGGCEVGWDVVGCLLRYGAGLSTKYALSFVSTGMKIGCM
jgi:hypothetical protein